MIQEPPVDKLIQVAGNKYALACGLAKRARSIIEQPHTATEISERYKPISAAAHELYRGKIKLVKE